MLSIRRGYVWLAAGLILALLAGAASYVTIQRVVSSVPKKVLEPAQVQALVATRDLPVHTLIGAGDVALRSVPPEVAAEFAVTDAKQAVGKLTTTDIARGEIIQGGRLIAPDYVGPRVAFAMDPQQVVVAFPATDLLGGLDVIRPGDHVDIMFSLDFSRANPDVATGLNSVSVLQDVRVADIVRSAGSEVQQAAKRPAVQAILLAVDPQDALTIKSFRDAGAAADLALRSPAANGLFDVLPVDGGYLLNRYGINWRAKR